MVHIFFMGMCLVIVCDKCAKGRKLKWHESVIFLISVLTFISMIDNYYK